MFRLNLDVRIGTRFKIVLDGITGHMVQGGKGGMRSPRVGVVPARKSLRPTAYAIRAQEQQKARNQEKGLNPSPKVDTSPNTRFRTERRRR